MQISYETLLNKMSEKIQQARMENSQAKVREYVQAVKTLCEVLLDEKLTEQSPVETKASPVASLPQSRAVSVSKVTERRLETGDGANGDSIFDF